jgi:hypothetical protein
MYFRILFGLVCFSGEFFGVFWGWLWGSKWPYGLPSNSEKLDRMTCPRRPIGGFNGLMPSRLKTEEVPRMGLNCHDH